MKRCLASLAIFATDLNLRARILSLSSLFSCLPPPGDGIVTSVLMSWLAPLACFRAAPTCNDGQSIVEGLAIRTYSPPPFPSASVYPSSFFRATTPRLANPTRSNKVYYMFTLKKKGSCYTRSHVILRHRRPTSTLHTFQARCLRRIHTLSLPLSPSLSLSLSQCHAHTHTHTHTHNTIPISHGAYIPKRVTKRVSLSSEQKRIRATNPYTKEYRDRAFPEAHTEQVYYLDLYFN